MALACRDEAKCTKVFNCSSNCGTVEVPTKDSEKRFQLTALSSGNVILYLTNTTNETELYPDLSQSFKRISVGQSQVLEWLAYICGWIYFVSFVIDLSLSVYQLLPFANQKSL